VTRNPEEHAERYADPVAPSEPKAPSFRFVKKHRPALLAKCVELGLAAADTSVTATGLAKLLRGAKVDPEALVGVEIVSQGPVDEEEPPLIPEEDPEASSRDVLPDPAEFDHAAFDESVRQKIADAVKVPFPSDVSEQDKAARRISGVRVHLPGVSQGVEVGPVKMTVGGVELKPADPDAFVDSLEAGAAELDALTEELEKYETPKSEVELRRAFALLGDLARTSGARIVITFGE